jgi:hypothetical protein
VDNLAHPGIQASRMRTARARQKLREPQGRRPCALEEVEGGGLVPHARPGCVTRLPQLSGHPEILVIRRGYALDPGSPGATLTTTFRARILTVHAALTGMD